MPRQPHYSELEKAKIVIVKISHLHHCRSVVCDGLAAIAVHKQKITTVRTEGALHCGLHSNTGVDVGDDLTLSLRSIGAWGSNG